MYYYGRFTESEWECIAWARSTKGKEAAKTKKQKFLKRFPKACRFTDGGSNWEKAFWLDEITYVVKKFVPYIFSKEDWEDFQEAEWIRTNSEFDCSGQEYTIGMSRYVVPNGTWIYQEVSFDY